MATRKPKTLHFWRGDLPHWQVEDGRYFVTIHLNGALPAVAQQKIREHCAQIRASPAAKDDHLHLSRMIFREMESWLDSVQSVAHLQQPDLAEMVVEAIEHRQQKRIWDMFSYVVMPNHVHLFFELANDLSLKRELVEFKRWTGHQAAKIEKRLAGRHFWQTEWFDHWSRSDEGDEKIVRYIRRNPQKAGLTNVIGEYKYCK